MRKPKKVKDLEDVLSMNFEYNLEVDYWSDRDNCSCEGIHRCSRLHIEKVFDVDILSITKEFAEAFEKDEVTEYCINRVLTSCKLYDNSAWFVSVSRGYYGEEIDSVKLENKKSISDWLYKLQVAETPKEKVFVALECEYGYILDDILEIEKWSIKDISRKDISIGQKDYYRKLEKEVIDGYKDFPFPLATCFIKDGKIRVIDGYHRLASNKSENIKVLIGS
jgi:hypothetical protein